MRSWVEVSLGRIRENFRAVRSLVGTGADVMPVVKADAYRHGAIEVSRVLESRRRALAGGVQRGRRRRAAPRGHRDPGS